MKEDHEDWADGRKQRMSKNRKMGGVGAWGRMEDSGRWRMKVGKREEEIKIDSRW